MAYSYALPPRLLALLEDMPLEELAFTPVPVRARHDGWTVERQKWFILRLALGGCVSVAARGVGMTRKSAYRLADVGLERSLCGERVPIVRNGRVVGGIRRRDNRLAMVVLNALDRRAVARPITPGVEAALFRLAEATERLGPY